MKSQLRDEFKRSKSERRKDWIKEQIKECKRLQKTVNALEGQMDLPKTKCPHCDGHL
jgi:transposase-like protein